MKVEPLIERGAVAERCAKLGREITAAYRGLPLTVVALMNGGMFFAADLAREIDLPLMMDSLAVRSYDDDASTGRVTLRCGLKLPAAGRHLLLVDDVLDTGRSMRVAIGLMKNAGARSVKSCVLLEKQRSRPDGLAHCDWTGFAIPDVYVVGCGLDSHELYRNLPFIGVAIEP